jgi:hypothetical protein
MYNTLYYILSKQDVISEQGGAKISFSTWKKDQGGKKIHLVHEKKVQGGKKLQNS